MGKDKGERLLNEDGLPTVCLDSLENALHAKGVPTVTLDKLGHALGSGESLQGSEKRVLKDALGQLTPGGQLTQGCLDAGKEALRSISVQPPRPD